MMTAPRTQPTVAERALTSYNALLPVAYSTQRCVLPVSTTHPHCAHATHSRATEMQRSGADILSNASSRLPTLPTVTVTSLQIMTDHATATRPVFKLNTYNSRPTVLSLQAAGPKCHAPLSLSYIFYGVSLAGVYVGSYRPPTSPALTTLLG